MAEGGVSAHDRFKCSICLEDFKTPKLLPCFHTFCYGCLETYMKNNVKRNKFYCPLCRSSIDLPQNGVEGFQTNFYIDTAKEANDKTVVPCDLCGPKTQAIQRCTDCEENLCSNCSSVHLKMKLLRHHKLIELSSIEPGLKRKLISRHFCETHKNEEIKFVCKACDQILCMVCKLTDHENHKTKDVESEAMCIREELTKTLTEKKLENKISEKENNLAKKRLQEQEISNILSRDVQAIMDQKNVLQQIIDKLAQTEVDKTRSHFDKIRALLSDEISKMERELKSAKACRDTVQLLLDHESDINIVSRGQGLREAVRNITIEEVEGCGTHTESVYRKGQIDENGLKSMLGIVSPAIPAQLSKTKRKFLSRSDLERIATIAMPDVGEGIVTGIALTENNKAWIAIRSSRVLYLVELSGKILKKVPLNDLAHYVVMNRKGDALVSCDKTIQCIKPSGKVEELLSLNTEYAQGLCSRTNEEGEEEIIFVCAKENYFGSKGYVKILKEGKCFDFDLCSNTTQCPLRITFDPNSGNMCVLDYNPSKLQVIDKSGQVVGTYESQKIVPCDVCFYSQDCILVVDDGTGIISMKSDASSPSVLLNRDCFSIAVNDDFLWVGRYNTVEVYKIKQ